MEIGNHSPFIEMQLMTFLQYTWDIKQHALYEKIRSKTSSELENERELQKCADHFHALSGLLLIADKFIAEEWEKFLRIETK